jgi:hypothetical protein
MVYKSTAIEGLLKLNSNTAGLLAEAGVIVTVEPHHYH